MDPPHLVVLSCAPFKVINAEKTMTQQRALNTMSSSTFILLKKLGLGVSILQMFGTECVGRLNSFIMLTYAAVYEKQ